jgi:hypothetical protein
VAEVQRQPWGNAPAVRRRETVMKSTHTNRRLIVAAAAKEGRFSWARLHPVPHLPHIQKRVMRMKSVRRPVRRLEQTLVRIATTVQGRRVTPTVTPAVKPAVTPHLDGTQRERGHKPESQRRLEWMMKRKKLTQKMMRKKLTKMKRNLIKKVMKMKLVKKVIREVMKLKPIKMRRRKLIRKVMRKKLIRKVMRKELIKTLIRKLERMKKMMKKKLITLMMRWR